MDLCNYHSHCTFCDGRAPAEDFVKAAIEAGFHSYGISSHSPLPFETDWSLKRSEVGNYLREMQRLKRIYASMLEVYVGLEIDYLNDEYGPSSLYFQQLPLDYRIGSVHYVVNPERGEMMDMDGRVEDFRRNLDKVFAGDLKLLIKNYFQASMRMVELGGFDFVAHADKVAMNGSLCDPGNSGQQLVSKHDDGLFEGDCREGSDDGDQYESLWAERNVISGRALF